MVRLAGTAPDAELAAQARQLVGQVAGVSSVADELAVVAAPGCLAAAKVEQALANRSGPGPTVTMNHTDGVFREDDYLVLEITMPAGSPEYLFVDLLTDAGAAIHLLPEPLTPDNLRARRQDDYPGRRRGRQARRASGTGRSCRRWARATW